MLVHIVLTLWVTAAVAFPLSPDLSHLQRTSTERTGSTTSPPLSVDTFRFLDNGIIRLGIDMTRGGTIGWLGPSSNTSLSLLNAHDFGRSVQGSFYSGPNPFNPEGKCSEPGGWGKPWPWNPIGSGDVYLHPAPILNVTVSPSNISASVWTVPLQWACDNVPCDCLFEQRITLIGSAVEVTLTMHSNRTDVTFYPGQTQELPAVYITGDYCHLWTYNGTAPFTGDTISEQPAVWGPNAWGSFTSGERWMAFTNASGYGVGVVSPFVSYFGAGFFDNGKNGVYTCVPKGLGPYDSQTGYIAPWGAEIIDPHAPYTYTFSLVLGQLSDIRSYALSAYQGGKDEPLTPHYDFVGTQSRVHCVYGDAIDSGLPIRGGGLNLTFTGPHPVVVGGLSVWNPKSALKITLNVSYHAELAGSRAVLLWVPLGERDSCAQCFAESPDPVVADGGYHLLTFDLTGVTAYTGLEAITRVAFQPLGSAPISPGLYGKALFALASLVTDSS